MKNVYVYVSILKSHYSIDKFSIACKHVDYNNVYKVVIFKQTNIYKHIYYNSHFERIMETHGIILHTINPCSGLEYRIFLFFV